MAAFVADTHSLIWYLEDSPRLGRMASEVFAACERGEAIIYIPTICLVEIVYLQEKGRIPDGLKAALDSALQGATAGLVVADLTARVVGAMSRVPRSLVPDMPDRIIAATAIALGLPLLSRDRALAVVGGLGVVW